MIPRTPLFHLTSLFVILLAGGASALPNLPLHAPPDVARVPAVPDVMPATQAASLAAPVAADDAEQQLARAEALRRIGQRESAIATLMPLSTHPNPAVAGEAVYRMALARLELGFPREAAGDLENLLTRPAPEPVLDRATFLLGVARKRAEDCGGAVAAFEAYAARAGLLAGHAALQSASCYQQLGSGARALAQTDQVLGQGGSRTLRIELLERQADVLEKSGDKPGALARWEQILDLARAASYRADVRLTIARLQLELGRSGPAVANLAAAVAETPGVRGAATALDRLVELGAQEQVSYYHAGLVRFHSGQYDAAQRNFEGALATPSEASFHPGAAYYRAVSRVRLGAELEGAAELAALPGTFPASDVAPDALLRGGRVFESLGRLGEAAAAYRRAAADYPSSAEADESLFRLGFVHLLRGAANEAAQPWSQLGAAGARPDLTSLGLLWHGKMAVLSGNAETARAAWGRAADAGPASYGGVRARGLLDPNADILARAVPLDLSRIGSVDGDRAELNAWAVARGASSLDALLAEQAADPALARTDELLALGLKLEAGWEIEDLATRVAGDPARMAALALALQQRGLDNAAVKQAQATLDVARQPVRQAPLALQKLLYPLPYSELFQSFGERYGVNPLLFAALVRQESHFLEDARSSADARGLTQVMPATGRQIASALGRPGFDVKELYNPVTSLEFGAYFFGQRLSRFGGSIFPALAAYNAGDVPVDRWLRDYGADDLDLFAERIPYAETNKYIKVIFENYAVYRALYGAGS